MLVCFCNVITNDPIGLRKANNLGQIRTSERRGKIFFPSPALHIEIKCMQIKNLGPNTLSVG